MSAPRFFLSSPKGIKLLLKNIKTSVNSIDTAPKSIALPNPFYDWPFTNEFENCEKDYISKYQPVVWAFWTTKIRNCTFNDYNIQIFKIPPMTISKVFNFKLLKIIINKRSDGVKYNVDT